MFLSVIAIGVYAIAELFAQCGLYLTEADRYDDNLEGIAQGLEADGSREVIHPYLGWVHNPQVGHPENIFGKSIPINHLGFKDDIQSIHQRSADCFIVGILGGSVAWHTSVAGAEIIKEQLNTHPAIQGREIILVRLATSGYKQPQQVMGGEFDAVVNIDGYNEVALALVENAYSGTSIVYPRAWASRTISALDPSSYATASRLLHLRGSRQQAARNMLKSSFRWSPLRRLIWLATDRSKMVEIAELGIEVSHTRQSSFVNHGPFDDNIKKAELKSSVIDLWKRSSVQLQRLCHATDTIYLHVLQPNQYVADSKVLSAHELKHAFFADQELGEVIKELYPRLLDEVDWLKNAGVEFSDQTMLFGDETDTIYSDPFCHYNQRGNEMLAAAVVQALLQLIPDSTPQP